MPRLLLINGPPASGKSTLARRYVDDHPWALNLDIDRIRGQLGRWRENPHTAGLLARDIALSAARTHLWAGHDVVVPQLVASPTFLDQLEELAVTSGATFTEIMLLDDEANTLRRFADRRRAAAEAEHDDARELLARDDAPDHLVALHDRLTALLLSRPDARTVEVRDGDIDGTYRALRHHLDQR